MKLWTRYGSAAAVLLALLAGCGAGPSATPAAPGGQGRARPVGAPGAGPSQPAPARVLAGAAFPLLRGAEWTFRGTTRSGDDSGAAPAIIKVTWTMKVLDVHQRAGWHAATMHGHPRDVVSFGSAPVASEYLIVWQDGRYYEPADGVATLARLRDPKDALADLVSDADLFLVMPAKVGDRFCAAQPADAEQPGYCWTLESAEPFDRSAIAGAPPAPPGGDAAWALWLRTRPDHSVLSFVPGLGFVAFDYQHHGTISEAELTLTAFQPGTP